MTRISDQPMVFIGSFAELLHWWQRGIAVEGRLGPTNGPFGSKRTKVGSTKSTVRCGFGRL